MQILPFIRFYQTETRAFMYHTDRTVHSPWARTRWQRLPVAQTIAAAIVAVAFPAFSAPAFTATNVGLPGVASSSLVCGDFNQDGRPDVLLTGSDGSFVPISQVWQNDSAGQFTNRNAGLPGLSSSAVARGDFDNDGRLDLVLTGFAGVDANSFPVYLSQMWRNRGNGTFTNLQVGLPGVDTGAVALGDFDNDGNLDLLLTGYSSTGAVAQVWRNSGQGTFTNINAGLPGVLYSSVAWGDLDGDGFLDILMTGTPNGFANTAFTQVWRNLGNGTFALLITDLPGVAQGAVAVGDLDGDGRLDIVLTGQAAAGAISQVWRNLGNGLFTAMNVGLPGVLRSAVALGDYDNDGKLDIVLAGMNNQSNPICEVWRNTGNWVFANLNAGFAGVRSGSVAWVDIDRDDRLDILVAGLNGSGNPSCQAYHNNSTSGSTTPLRIDRITSLDSGSYQLSFAGQIGFGYTVWSSTNLVQWTALGSPSESGPAAFRFSDQQTVNLPYRSYRLSRP